MARTFNGTTDKITTSLVAPTYSQMTAAGWAFYNTATRHNARIISDGHTDVTFHGFQLIYSSQDGLGNLTGIELTVGDGSSQLLDTVYNLPSPIAQNNWVHVGATYNHSVIVMYLNGVNVQTSATKVLTIAGGSNVTMGTGVEYSGDFMSGRLAEIVLWNTALSGIQMAALAKGIRPHRLNSVNLVGWWPFDGLQSPEPDLSGANNPGTLTGTGTSSTGPPITMFTARWPRMEPITPPPPPPAPNTAGWVDLDW